MRYGSVLRVGCLAGVLLASTAGAAAEEGHQGHHRANKIAVIVGGTYEVEHSENLFTWGLEYERHLNDRFGLSATFEHLPHNDASLFVFPVVIRVAGPLTAVAGPGFEHKARRVTPPGEIHRGEVERKRGENLFLFRLGAHLGFDVGGPWSIIAGFDVDFIDEHEEWQEALVYTAGIGFSF